MDNYAEINYEKNMEMLNRAFSYCSDNLSHDEIISVLKSDDDLKKQLCLIELDSLNNQNEADILINCLTNNPGPVRETASFKISELIKQKTYQHFFNTKEILDTFVKAVTDINPSVSRNTVEIIRYVGDSDYLFNKFISEINKTLSQIDTEVKGKSYTANKKNFALYWYLEAIINILNQKNSISDEFAEILKKTSTLNDYTIREKTAKIISLIKNDNPKINETAEILRKDSNIYVRKYLTGSP